MSVNRQPKHVFRLSTVFAAIVLFVLLLPLSGGYFFRIYENELVRQTETELIAQAVFISSFYKSALADETDVLEGYGNAITLPSEPLDEKYKPLPPLLDLRTADILPPRPDGVTATIEPWAAEVAAGQKLMPALQEARLSTLASMRLLNPQGTVIAGTGDIGLSLAEPEEVQSALMGKYASVLRQRISDEPRPSLASISRGTDTRVFIALPVILEDRVIGAVYMSRSPRNILKALYEEKESVFLAGLFVLGFAGIIAALLSYAIGRPLRTLNRRALQLASGEKNSEPMPSAPIEELATLMQSFEKMSLTIEARSEYIRNFAMHLAHEFKTPLTAIQGAIELMRDHPHDMSQEQRTRFMENIGKDTDRLRKLVTRLLELARADVLQPGNESCDLSLTISALKAKYQNKVVLAHPVLPLNSSIGAEIIETVLVNLIDNALQHGADTAKIHVEPAQDIITIDVTDNGPGISEGNMAKIFTPFFTTRRDKGGTGLGLVISQSLLKAHGGSIMAVPSEKGAHFRLTLKSA